MSKEVIRRKFRVSLDVYTIDEVDGIGKGELETRIEEVLEEAGITAGTITVTEIERGKEA